MCFIVVIWRCGTFFNGVFLERRVVSRNRSVSLRQLPPENCWRKVDVNRGEET